MSRKKNTNRGDKKQFQAVVSEKEIPLRPSDTNVDKFSKHIKLTLILAITLFVFIIYVFWLLKNVHSQNVCNLDNDKFCVTVEYPKIISPGHSFNAMFTIKRREYEKVEEPFVVVLTLSSSRDLNFLKINDKRKEIDLTSKDKSEWCPIFECRSLRSSSWDEEGMFWLELLVNMFKTEKWTVVASVGDEKFTTEGCLFFKIKNDWYIIAGSILYIIISIISIKICYKT